MSETRNPLATVQDCFNKADWQGVLQLSEALVPSRNSAAYFFRTRALFELGHMAEARACVEEGLRLSPESEWGIILKFNILKRDQELGAALACLDQFLTDHPNTSAEAARALLTDQAAEAGLFDLATKANDARRIFQLHPPTRLAVAIQCFAKRSTLERSLQALLKCRGVRDFSLFILQDSLNGSAKRDRYAQGHAEVRAALAAAMPDLSAAFHSVTLLQNVENMGTTGSCRRLLDHVAEHAEAFIFLEDDCILAPDALDWARHHLEQSITPQGVIIGGCESIFFDSRRKTPTPAQFAALETIARHPDHRWAHTLQGFVPSTCFFTTSAIWRGISSIRSFPRGDFNLTLYLQAQGYHCLMPVVPRAADEGMLEELGYSVNTLGRDNIADIKNSYLLSRDEPLEPEFMTAYQGEIGVLFDASVNLNDQAIAALCARLR